MRTLKSIAASGLATGLVGVAALFAAPAASAAPIEVNGCVDGNYFMPAGAEVVLDFTQCADRVNTPLSTVDNFNESGSYVRWTDYSWVDGKFTYFFEAPFANFYTETDPGDGSGTGPWASDQFNSFLFSCGLDTSTYLPTLNTPDVNHPWMDAQTRALYIEYGETMPRYDYCASPKDLTQWFQAIGRTSEADACPAGYTPSWDQWPNGGTGGWTCTRSINAYGP